MTSRDQPRSAEISRDQPGSAGISRSVATSLSSTGRCSSSRGEGPKHGQTRAEMQPRHSRDVAKIQPRRAPAAAARPPPRRGAPSRQGPRGRPPIDSKRAGIIHPPPGRRRTRGQRPISVYSLMVEYPAGLPKTSPKDGAPCSRQPPTAEPSAARLRPLCPLRRPLPRRLRRHLCRLRRRLLLRLRGLRRRRRRPSAAGAAAREAARAALRRSPDSAGGAAAPRRSCRLARHISPHLATPRHTSRTPRKVYLRLVNWLLTLAVSRPHLGHISAISRPYLGHISAVSLPSRPSTGCSRKAGSGVAAAPGSASVA